MTRHVVITPARNEEAVLPHLIASMTAQTVPPDLWIVVDDDSADATAALVDAAAATHPWIRRIGPPETAARVVGGHVARMFLWGVDQVEGRWDFASKIDADLTLPDDYFEKIMAEMERDPELGVAGGGCWEERGGRLVLERVAPGHTRGALKTYRAACYADIGGVRPVDGWDGLDGVYARMHGWRTRSFEELRVIHHRPTGSFGGVLRGRFVAGRFAHFLGYHPLFFAARVARRLVSRPFFVGGLALGAGYLADLMRGGPVHDDPALVAYLRREQLARLSRGWWPRQPTP
jgi:glycosyltransferase involved in cell wall biosynthesis